MSLILYLPLTEGPGNQLYDIVKKTASKRKIELCRSIQELSDRLKRPIFDVEVTILLATDREDLLVITSLGDFLNRMKIILVLPDLDMETIALGHLLRPRFITWQDDDFAQLGMFLKNLLSLNHEPVNGTTKKQSM